MRIAAYQAPFLPIGSMGALPLIQKQVRAGERDGEAILCCPEAILGGLADDSPNPLDIALNVESGQLQKLLAPLASESVTTIVGFTEKTEDKLYNSAAIFHRGAVIGIYRKRHPAIRRSVYSAGLESPIFRVGNLSFGLMICNDSNFGELATSLSARGARAIFVPSNNGLPPDRARVLEATRAMDIARAKENKVMIVRADVAGKTGDRAPFGASVIVDETGKVLCAGKELGEDLLIAELV